ncbi:MAG: MotA/TolQ/ExbB proton channel family protein [Deltaproteobacteria bacterium]|nr:MotA/TolQ/ExbB proton channel family protein [Kofleriaceae bacterium]
MNLQDTLTSLADLGATWVMWLLVGLSILGLAIAVERAIVMFATRDDIRRLKDDLVASLRKGDVDGARSRLERSRSFEARIARAGLSDVDVDPGAAAERIAGATQTARVSMERRLAFLGTVGSNAPFVGLLGTVIGIINAFHELESASGKVSAGLMAEIGEALVATAVGICVAIPAVVAFNYFNRVIRARLSRADALSREITAFLKSGRLATGQE